MNWLLRLYRVWLNRHDPAWTPTGVRPCFTGFDPAKLAASAKRSEQWAKARRKAAAQRAQPADVKREKVTQMGARKVAR